MEVSGDGAEHEDLTAVARRCPASRRLLAANDPFLPQQPQVVSFAPGCGANGPRPSRRREEAKALQNLQRRVEACRLTKGLSPVDPGGPSTSTAIPPGTHQLLDNRPQILQKVRSRPRPKPLCPHGLSYSTHSLHINTHLGLMHRNCHIFLFTNTSLRKCLNQNTVVILKISIVKFTS